VSDYGGATISNWKFTDGQSGTVTVTASTGTTANTWSGAVVQSGTVSTTVSYLPQPITAPLTVNARTGWAFTAVSPVREPNGGGTGPCTGVLPVLSTPTSSSSLFGFNCLQQEWYTAEAQVSAGPNSGYWYVTSASNANGGVTTTFQWERVPDLDNTSSTFYKEQTGTYNSSTDPGGCISGSNLASQTQRHESGSVQGHWGFYNNAQNNQSNNLGTVAEGQVGVPSLTVGQFQTQITNALSSAAGAILQAEEQEPYPVNYDQNDTLLGYINFPPSYTSCK
jgi:hypothetical protein